MGQPCPIVCHPTVSSVCGVIEDTDGGSKINTRVSNPDIFLIGVSRSYLPSSFIFPGVCVQMFMLLITQEYPSINVSGSK